MSSQRILVVGGGVVGLCTAYYCARLGHKVTLLDRLPERRDGCSFGNAGLVVPSHFVPLAAPGLVKLAGRWMADPESPFYIQPRVEIELWGWLLRFLRAATPAHVQRSSPLLRDLNLASRQCFDELALLPKMEFGWTKKGLLMLCRSPEALDHEAGMAEMAKSLGLEAEVLNASQVASLEPNVQLSIAGAVFFPGDAHLDPARFMDCLQQECARLGVEMIWQTDVASWRVDNERIVSAVTSRGDFLADEFVLCGGVWSPIVSHELGIKLPMQAGKGYSLTLRQPREMLTRGAIFTEARVAVTPMGSSLRFGGTLELSGIDPSINLARVHGIVRSVPRYFPGFREEDFASVRPWQGLRPCSPDGLPYIGRVQKYRNLSVGTGHAMMGLSLGPITGRAIAEIISGQSPSVDVAPLAPDRFG